MRVPLPSSGTLPSCHKWGPRWVEDVASMSIQRRAPLTSHPSMGCKYTHMCLSAEYTHPQGHMISAPKLRIEVH
eukprot:2861069-Pyramimonas_sp.AAC.1